MGHAICTGAAVLGGKQLASHINENMVAVSASLQSCSIDIRKIEHIGHTIGWNENQ